MARRVFFSFQFSEDNWRANIVRNSWVTQDRKDSGFFDSADWEEVKKKTDAEIKKWINGQMNGCSVTVVLVGSKTCKSKWVKYEIEKAWNDKKPIFGIYIHNLRCPRSGKSSKGNNPFESPRVHRRPVCLSQATLPDSFKLS